MLLNETQWKAKIETVTIVKTEGTSVLQLISP